MTVDPETYATVFRAAADGVKSRLGGTIPMDQAAHLKAIEGAFSGVASLFEKITEAEQQPLRVIAERDILLAA